MNLGILIGSSLQLINLCWETDWLCVLINLCDKSLLGVFQNEVAWAFGHFVLSYLEV